MSGTNKNENLQNLNQISSIVSERDMKIWENVAYSNCYLKQAEQLKSETNRMKAAIIEKKKETKMLDDYVVQLHKSNSIQLETLKISEQSVVMHQALKEKLLEEVNSSKTFYAETLEMYNQELKEYRAMYENASQSYKDLQIQQVEMQKLEVKKMMLDANISTLKKSQQQFHAIQEQIFHKTVVDFAEFYILYHKNEALKLQVEETKKVEQQLLKEHLHLTEAVKEKRRIYEKSRMESQSASKCNSTIQIETTKDTKETDKVQQFLDEEILPCSLTSITQRMPNFNEDNSKVKILEVKVVKPPAFRSDFTPKPQNLELRKKMIDVMLTVQKEVKGNNSFQFPSVSSQPQIKEVNPASQQSQRSILSQNKNATFEKLQSELQNKMGSQFSQNNATSQGSQNRIIKRSDDSVTKTSKETAASSILKTPIQTTFEKIDSVKQDSVSKFFNTKKKVVTFQNEVVEEPAKPEIKKFALFSMEDRQTSRKSNKNFNVPFSFSEITQTNKIDKEMSVDVSDEQRDSDETGNGFTIETLPTTFATTCEESLEQINEHGFDGITSPLDHDFDEQSLNLSGGFAVPAESTTFNFLGAPDASNNFFGFP